MSNPRLIKALAKVMIAAAWSDGSVSHEEINSLKDLLFRLPDMSEREWAELEIYVDSPVAPEERARLIGDLQNTVTSSRDRALAVSALEDMIQADGALSAEERQVLEEVRIALEHVDVGLFGQMSRLVRSPVERRSAAAAAAPNREIYLEDFIRNKIYYKLRQHLKEENLKLDLPEPELKRLSMAGGLMARVAYIDREVSPEEFEKIATAVEIHYGVDRDAAVFVAEVAVSTISKDLDYYRLTRQFFEATSEEERVRFLETLFAVAASDGLVSHEEMEEIRTIASVLKLTHQQYITAKLSIPREQRAY